jgi:uncharacterized protein YdeI (YjbR/CyaY-like superfamily)
MSKVVPSTPADLPIIVFETAQEWDIWLRQHGGTARGLYMKIAKKGSGLPSVTYPEAVEIALCHGWIDAIRRSFDGTYFLQKFNPRAPRSVWSEVNKKKVLQLTKAKLMLPAGLAAVQRAKANGQWANAYAPASAITVPPDLEAALKKNKKARSFFATLKGSNRYAILHRLHITRKEETRARKIVQFVGMLERGEVFYP